MTTMKKHLTLIAGVVLLTLSAAMAKAQSSAPTVQAKQAELNTWKTYTLKTGRVAVSASFPTHPAMTTSKRYEMLDNTLIDRMIGAYADGVVYGIYSFENHPKLRQSLQEFVNQQLGGWNLSTEKAVKIGSFSGKEYSVSNKRLVSTAQFFSVDNQFYKITATGAPAEDPGVKQFFSSIRFDNTQGIEVFDGPGAPFSDPCDQVFKGSEVDSKLRLVMKPEPAYTEEARWGQVIGTVVLTVVFSCNGGVENIRVAKELPKGLTEQAVAAAKKIKFIPAVKNGKYVSMWIQLEYNFNLY